VDDINIIIKALLAKSGEGSIKALQEKLNKDGITLKVNLDDTTMIQLEKAGKKVAKSLGDEFKQVGQEAEKMSKKQLEAMQKATENAEKYAKSLENIRKSMSNLTRQRDEMARSEKKQFEDFIKNDDPIWSKLKQRSIATPKDDERFKQLPLSVKGNYFDSKGGGTEITKMAQEMGVSLEDLYKALASGKPKFDESILDRKQEFLLINNEIKALEKLQVATEKSMEKQIPFEQHTQRLTEDLNAEAKAADRAADSLSNLSKVVTKLNAAGEASSQDKTFNNNKNKSSTTEHYVKDLENEGQLKYNGETVVDNPEKLIQAQRTFDYKIGEIARKYEGLKDISKDIINPYDLENLENKIQKLDLESLKEDFQDVDNLIKKIQDDVNKAAKSFYDLRVQQDNDSKLESNFKEKQDQMHNQVTRLFVAGKATEEEFIKMNKEIASAKSIEGLKELNKELDKTVKLRNVQQHKTENSGKLVDLFNRLRELNNLKDQFGVVDVNKISDTYSKLMKLNVGSLKSDIQEVANTINKMEKDSNDALRERNKKIADEVKNRFNLSKEASDGEQAQKRVYDKLVNIYHAGKISEEQFAKMSQTVARESSHMTGELQAVEDKIRDITNEYKIANAKSKNVEIMGFHPQLMAQNGGLKNIKDLEHFKRILKESSTELEHAEIRYVELDRATGNWMATIKQTGREDLILRGIIEQTNGDLIKRKELSKEASRTDQSMLSQFKVALERVPVWMAAMTAFYGTKRAVEDMVQNILEIDKQMTEMMRVMDQGTNFTKMLQDSTNMAKEFGRTITEVNEAMIGFARGGFDQKQIQDLTKTAIIMSNVSDLNVEQSMDNLTSAMTQFNIAAENSMSIVDKLNEVDNNYAITTADLAAAISRAGSTAQTFGITLDELVGNVTAIGVATRESGEVIGNSLKTIYSRLTSSDSASALAAVGVNVKKANGENETASKILTELGEKWHKLTATQQQHLGVVVAGRYQLSRFLALMNEYKVSVDATKTSLNSQGSALQENQIYQQSFEARINRLKAAWQELSLTFGDAVIDDSIIAFTNSLISILKYTNGWVGSIGVLTPALGGLSIILSLLYKNFREFSFNLGSMILKTKEAEGSVNKLKTSLKGLGFGLVGTAVMSAVGFGVGLAVEKLIQHYGKLNEEKKKALEVDFDLIRSTQSLQKELQELEVEYNKLERTTNPTTEEKKRLLIIQSELVERFNVSATGVNAEGKAYSDSTELIRARIAAMQNEIEIQTELNETKLKAKAIEDNKVINKGTSSIKKDEENIKNAREELKSLEEDIANKRKINAYDPRLLKVNTITTGQKYLDPANPKVYEENSKVVIQAFNGYLSELNQTLAKHTEETGKVIDEHVAHLQSRATVALNNLSNSGKKVTDEQRLFVKNMAKSVVMDGEDISNSMKTMDNLTDQIVNSNFKELVEEYKKTRTTFAMSGTPEDNEALKKSHDAIMSFFDNEIAVKIPNSTTTAKKSIDAFRLSLEETYTTNVKSDALTRTFQTNNAEIAKTFDDATNSLKGLNQALQEQKDNGYISTDAMIDLVMLYPELTSSIKETAKGYFIEEGAINKVRKAKIDHYTEAIRTEKGLTTATISGVDARLKKYGLELKGIGLLSDAYAKIDEITMNEALAEMGDEGRLAPEEENAIVQQAMSRNDKLKQEIAEYKQIQDEFDLLVKGLNDTSLGGAKGKENKKDPVEQYKINEFESALESLNTQLKESEGLMGQYSITSEEYRNELDAQIKTIESQQKLSSEEADRLRNRNTAIEDEISSLGEWNKMTDKQKENFNDLSKELENNNNKISDLGSNWWDFLAQIDSKKFEKVNSELGEMNETMESLDDEMQTSQLRMNMMEEDSEEYRKEIALQNDILKKKQEQAKISMEFIEKELATGKLNIKQQKELNKEYNNLKKSVLEYDNSIKQNNDTLRKQQEEYADKIIDLYKDMYKKQKETASDAIDEELDKIKDAYDEEVKIIEKRKDKYDELIDAKKRALNDDSDERKYNQDLANKQSERQEILNKLNVIKNDDSSQAKAQRIDLNKQLSDVNMEIENMQYDHSKELQEKKLDDLKDANDKRVDSEKETLKTEYDKTKESYDKTKEYIKKYYDDILNNEVLFSDKKKEIMELGINKEIELYDTLRDKVVTNSKTMETAIRTSIQNALKDGQSIQKILESKSASELGKNISDSSSGGYTNNGMPEVEPKYRAKNEDEQGKIDKMKVNSRKWNETSEENRKRELEEANKWMGEQIGANYEFGTWYKDGLPLYHNGGVVGNNGSSFAKIANKFFNTSANEEVIKALQGEIMTPDDNLSNYFKPNMQKLISSITPSAPSGSSGDINYYISLAIDRLTGDKEGAKVLINELVKGVRKKGGKI
jgi:TP901 family phage tail tape measure protein